MLYGSGRVYLVSRSSVPEEGVSGNHGYIDEILARKSVESIPGGGNGSMRKHDGNEKHSAS